MNNFSWASILVTWVIFAFLIAFLAKYKNRSAFSWIALSLIISPLLSLLILLFMGRLPETVSQIQYEYSGEPSLNNDSFRIYLTRKYGIEKNDALGGYLCNEKIFNSVDLALIEASTLERKEHNELKVDDRISSLAPHKAEASVNKSKILIIAVLIIILISGVYFAYVNGFFQMGSSSDVISNLPDVKLQKDGDYKKVNQLIADSFAKGVLSNSCYKLTIKDKEESNNFCIEISSLIRVKNTLYVVLTGQKLDEDMSEATAHVDQGVIKFLILQDDGKKVYRTHESLFEYGGSYGNIYAANAKLIKLNGEGEMGWVTGYGDVHQGYVSEGIEIHAVVGDTIRSILELGTLSDNSAACGDDPKCLITTTKAVAKMTPGDGDKFFTIQVSVTRSTGVAKDIKENEPSFTLKYSQKSKEYKVPASYSDLFSF